MQSSQSKWLGHRQNSPTGGGGGEAALHILFRLFCPLRGQNNRKNRSGALPQTLCAGGRAAPRLWWRPVQLMRLPSAERYFLPLWCGPARSAGPHHATPNRRRHRRGAAALRAAPRQSIVHTTLPQADQPLLKIDWLNHLTQSQVEIMIEAILNYVFGEVE